MDIRVLFNHSRGSGGGSKPSTASSVHIIDFIDDHRFIDSVIGGHSYDSSDEEKCNADDLHGIVNNILYGATLLVDKDSFPKTNLSNAPQTIIPSDISHQIYWIYCQDKMSKSSSSSSSSSSDDMDATHGENVEERLRAIFQNLRRYRWTTQVLLVLAAFARQYGDFWYASEAPPDGRDALTTYLLRALSSLKKKVISDEKKKKAIKPLNKVVNDLWELTTCVFDLSKLVDQHRGKHVPELAKAFRTIPGWSCEAIIAILATANIFAQIIGVHRRLAESEMGILTSRVSDRKSDVLAAVQTCKNKIGLMEDYQKYVKKVEAPVDIADFLRSLLAKDSSSDPIVTGPNDTPVKFESFRKKNVLLIISDQKISECDIATLERIHYDPWRFGIPEGEDQKDEIIQSKTEKTEKETLYELVWIPVVDAGHDKLEALPSFGSMRRWAFMVHPQKMNRFTGRYIKEEWHFKRETMVVVLDSLGWVENVDAMPMLRIWETDAFPYTGNGNTHPWRDPCSWVQLELREPAVQLDKIQTEYMLFYGGTAATKSAVDVTPNLCVVPIGDMKLFRIRLRSCLICRFQALQILNIEKNPLRDRIVYETCEAYKAGQRGGVAIFAKGPDLQAQHVGLLSDLKLVMDQVAKDGWTALAESFKKKYKDVQGTPMCLDVCIPDYTGLENLYCHGCSRFMRCDLSLTCCHSDSH